MSKIGKFYLATRFLLSNYQVEASLKGHSPIGLHWFDGMVPVTSLLRGPVFQDFGWNSRAEIAFLYSSGWAVTLHWMSTSLTTCSWPWFVAKCGSDRCPLTSYLFGTSCTMRHLSRSTWFKNILYVHFSASYGTIHLWLHNQVINEMKW